MLKRWLKKQLPPRRETPRPPDDAHKERRNRVVDETIEQRLRNIEETLDTQVETWSKRKKQ